MQFLDNRAETRTTGAAVMTILVCGFFALFFPLHLSAQAIPPDKDTLEKGEGAGMARYADINGYPGPKHVLEMREQLQLTEEQVKDIEAIFDEMSERARIKGLAIIAEEEKLAELFTLRKASREHVERVSSLIGTLRGELRAIHLTAHLQSAEVLSKDQCVAYGKLRHGDHMSGQHHKDMK